MSNEFLSKYQADFDGAVDHFKKELSNLRTGRANPSMVEDILVESYGVKTPIKQLGTIGVPEARSLTIEPWDKNLLKEIEKSLTYADLGVGIKVDSTLVRVTVPQMTEENRKKLVKMMGEKLEEAKIAVRSIREKVKEEIVRAEKDGNITEDDRYDYVEDLDKRVGELNKQFQELSDKKEQEILTV
jgi:ribosome recycling factor